MAIITGKHSSGFAEVINGTPDDDIIFPLGGWDVVNGGAGVDTLVISGRRAAFNVSADPALSFVDSVSGASATVDTTTLTGIERIEFNDISVALDMATDQAGGQTALLIGAVLGRSALVEKKVLVGSVLELFDQGFTLQQLAGAVMRLEIWGALANGGSASASNKQIASYLLQTVNGQEPNEALLASAVAALDSETALTQGSFLWHLAESGANQTQVGLVGLIQAGMPFI